MTLLLPLLLFEAARRVFEDRGHVPRPVWLGLVLQFIGRHGSLGGQCLGGASFALRVSGLFPFTSSSLSCSIAPSELQPFFHPWAGSDCCSFRPVGQGGYRACFSFSRLLQLSLCDSQVTGGWRPMINLSLLNGFVDVSHFHMETTQTVLQSLREGDWLVSLDLQDAYLQVPVHPSSRW